MPIKLTRIKENPNAFIKSEFIIVKKILDFLEIDYESDFSITKNCVPVYYGDREICFPEHFSYTSLIPKEKILFRPLRNERHSNILIEMFEESEFNIDHDRLEINEFINNKGKKRFTGWLVSHGETIKNSIIKSSPSIPILKTSIVAKLLFNDCEYDVFKNMLSSYLSEQKELNKHV